MKAMKIFSLLTLAMSLCMGATAAGITKVSSVHIYGRVHSPVGHMKLKCFLYHHHINAFEHGGLAPTLYFPVDGKGRFSISFEAEEPGRITMMDSATSAVILDQQLYEIRDSVHVEANLQTDSTGSHFVSTFSGRGAGKYRSQAVLGGLSDNDISFRLALYNRNGKDIYQVADSILMAQNAELRHFKRDMSALAYQVMQADLEGSVFGKMVWGIFGGINRDFYMKQVNDSVITANRAALARFLKYSTKDLPDSSCAMSPFYVDYVFQLMRVMLAYSDPKRPFSLSDLCGAIKHETRGQLQEVTLAYALGDDNNLLMGFDKPIASQEYTDCLKDAQERAKTQWVKSNLMEILQARGKGAPAFDFALPADSTGRLVRMSDLKGKVVLIDIWAYQCTGCTLFAQAFHKAVLPNFKDRDDFKVVSIMTSPTSMEGYMRRLRGTIDKRFGERLSIYTYPDNINLFGGKGVAMGEMINNHYRINGYPYFLLIDKEGRIFSSTIPFFEDEDSENVGKLTTLIKEALNE